MNIGDTVLYTEGGKEFVATILEFRFLDGHTGKNDEPLVHLGFFTEVMKPGPDGKLARVKLAGTHQQYDQCQIRLDVAHTSHEFLGKDGKPKLIQYPGGRWKEATVIANPEVLDPNYQSEVDRMLADNPGSEESHPDGSIPGSTGLLGEGTAAPVVTEAPVETTETDETETENQPKETIQ